MAEKSSHPSGEPLTFEQHLAEGIAKSTLHKVSYPRTAQEAPQLWLKIPEEGYDVSFAERDGFNGKE